MIIPAQIDVIFGSDDSFGCDLQREESFVCSMGESFTAEMYHGATNIIPSGEQQILETEGKVISENIIIEPVPSNYGLITWDGTTLIVS